MKKNNFNYWGPLLITLSCGLSTVNADETEIYFADKSGEVPPNVLFLIDSSGSMVTPVVGDPSNRTRVQILRDTFNEVMRDAPTNLNVGLMHYANQINDVTNPYYWSSIKGVNFPVMPIDSKVDALMVPYQNFDNLPNPAAGAKVRDFLSSIVQSWNPSGYTPIVDSLYEAARYYRGDLIGWGAASPLLSWAAHPLTYGEIVSCTVPTRLESCILTIGQCTGAIDSCDTPVEQSICCRPAADGSCPDGDMTCGFSIQTCNQIVCDQLSTSIDSKHYKSPVEYSCQANYLVLMSDGKPEYPYYPTKEPDGTGYYPPSVAVPIYSPEQVKVTQKLSDYMGKTCADKPLGYASGTCGPELTHWLATTDIDSNVPGDQSVQTFTVGLAMDEVPVGKAYLKSLTTTDDGFFDASNSSQLSNAFSAILNKVSKAALSFSSPTYSVDQANLLANSDEVYIPVFDRDIKPLWPGNLRKFKRNAQGEIVDASGNSVLNKRGEFLATARDLWAKPEVKADITLNGADVTIGGAANILPLPNLRKLYTDVSNAVPAFANPVVLNNTANVLDKTNFGTGKFITKTLLGNATMTDAQAQALLDFARGWSKAPGTNGQYTPRYHMGDMLNTKPLLVDYGNNVKRVFATTNEGFLHAIDTDTGVEQWAFMPKTLLKNIKTFYDNTLLKTHVYGIDGPLTLWNYDSDHNGKIDNTNDKRILFFGLRRGGNAYYALDITSPDNPKVLWRKSFGDGGAWNHLGETWSKPSLATLRIASATTTDSGLRTVLVFGAGYDPAKDAETNRQPDQLGLDVMIVDALDGTLYWSLANNVAGASSLLKHSIPGDIRVMDMDRNGALDRLYFADTGGYLWRVDMDIDVRDGGNTMYDYTKARLTKLADLGTNTGSDKRKFFYEPDVAMMQYAGKTVMTIALGSGYRTHPLNTTIKDRFYVLVDPNVYNEAPTDFAAITDNDLQAARDASGIPYNFSLLTGSKKGWYYDLKFLGEKALAPALTFMNKVIFTSFAPVNETGQGASGDPCEVPPNSARSYILNLLTAKPVANLDADTATGVGGRDDFIISGTNEIPSAAQIVFRQPVAQVSGPNDSSACTADNCHQTVEIRIGKMNLPLMDETNSSVGDSTVQGIAESVDLSNIMPRVFWRDQDVQKPGAAQ